MRRRRVLWAVVIVLAAVAVVAGSLGALLKQVPDFYTGPETAAKADDDVVASAVITRYGDLQSGILANDAQWGASFSAAELNAFFREHVDEGKQLAFKVPEPLRDPRIAIDGDRIRIGCRVGEGELSVIASIELQAWLVDREVNTVAVKICDVRVGALPWESQMFLDRVTEWARNQNTDVTWYRHEGRPVGVFRLYANQQRPPSQLRTVLIGDGRLAIAGRSTQDLRGPTEGRKE